MPVKTAFILLMLFILFSCSPDKYLVITSQTSPSEQDIKSKKFIFLSNKHVKNPERFAYLINAKKSLEFEKEFEVVKENNTKRLLRSVKNVIDENYSAAYNELAKIPKHEFDYEAQILLADALHGMHIDTLNYIKVYQRVVDSTRDETIRSIAIKRHRFLKYEK